jgi:hypothetical protein
VPKLRLRRASARDRWWSEQDYPKDCRAKQSRKGMLSRALP